MMYNNNFIKKLCGASFLLFTIIGCKETIDPNQPNGFIQVKGSDTIVNAEQKIAEDFMSRYPQVFVSITGGGTGVGVASLINKSCDVAAASRDMSPKEISLANKHGVFPKEFIIAFDGVALIVNKNNPINHITIQDLHNIFTGKASNWSEFGGPDLTIVTLSREVSSGTYAYFKEKVIHLGKKNGTDEFSSGTLLLTSSQAIVEEVANNDSAIGYLGMGYVSNRTKTLAVGTNSSNCCPADIDCVLSKKYPLARPLYFITDGEPAGITKLFLDFSLSDRGQKHFLDTGFVPLRFQNETKIR